MANTGYKKFLNRSKYIGGVFQYNEPNTEFLPGGAPDPNYIAPVQDLTMCPTSVPVWPVALKATNSGMPICATSSTTNLYKDTSGTPVNGTKFYTESPGVNQWTGGNGQWWGYNSTTTRLRIASGEVNAAPTTCF